jgi:hypothetical protein
MRRFCRIGGVGGKSGKYFAQDARFINKKFLKAACGHATLAGWSWQPTLLR